MLTCCSKVLGPGGEGGSRQLGKPLANWAGSFSSEGVALGPLKCAGRIPLTPPAPLPGILEVTFLGYVFSIVQHNESKTQGILLCRLRAHLGDARPR